MAMIITRELWDFLDVWAGELYTSSYNRQFHLHTNPSYLSYVLFRMVISLCILSTSSSTLSSLSSGVGFLDPHPVTPSLLSCMLLLNISFSWEVTPLLLPTFQELLSSIIVLPSLFILLSL